jgi:predicted ester cyclase
MGDFFGGPPSGNIFKYLGIHILTIKDGKIVEGWILEDMLYLMQQLGMELKPKEGEK